MSTCENRQEHDRTLPGAPSPGPATTGSDRRRDTGAAHAPSGGPDARYEHLRHAALHARAEAFPLGLAMLTRHGLTAWTRALVELPQTAPAHPPVDLPALPSPGLTRELVNILAALTLVPA